MATGGWNPWKKIRVVVLLLLFFKVALLEFFFSKCSKKPTVKSVLQIFLLHDWYGELLMFHSRGSFKWQWMFLVLPKKFTLLKIIQNCHSNIFKQLRYIIFKQIQKRCKKFSKRRIWDWKGAKDIGNFNQYINATTFKYYLRISMTFW